MEKETIEDMEWVKTPDPEIELARKIRKKEAEFKRKEQSTSLLLKMW